MPGKKIDYFSALYNVAKLINASLEPARVLEEITRGMVETMRLKACSLRLLEPEGRVLHLGASWGLSSGYLRKGPILVEKSGLDQEALHGQVVYIEDAQSDRRFQYKAQARKEGIKSVLVVPLRLEKKSIGVLRVYSEQTHRFNANDVKFMEAVANLSAIALENARLHNSLKTEFDLLAAHTDRLDDN
jgi:GAF domain-containing protein